MPSASRRYPTDELLPYLDDHSPRKVAGLRQLDTKTLSDRGCREVLQSLVCPPQDAHLISEWPSEKVRHELRELISWYQCCPDTPLGQPVVFSRRSARRLQQPWQECFNTRFVPPNGPNFGNLHHIFALHIQRGLLAVHRKEQTIKGRPEPFPLGILFGLSTTPAQTSPHSNLPMCTVSEEKYNQPLVQSSSRIVCGKVEMSTNASTSGQDPRLKGSGFSDAVQQRRASSALRQNSSTQSVSSTLAINSCRSPMEPQERTVQPVTAADAPPSGSTPICASPRNQVNPIHSVSAQAQFLLNGVLQECDSLEEGEVLTLMSSCVEATIARMGQTTAGSDTHLQLDNISSIRSQAQDDQRTLPKACQTGHRRSDQIEPAPPKPAHSISTAERDLILQLLCHLMSVKNVDARRLIHDFAHERLAGLYDRHPASAVFCSNVPFAKLLLTSVQSDEDGVRHFARDLYQQHCT